MALPLLLLTFVALLGFADGGLLYWRLGALGYRFSPPLRVPNL
jgi:hypothetical protein